MNDILAYIGDGLSLLAIIVCLIASMKKGKVRSEQ